MSNVTQFKVTQGVTLSNIIPLNIFLLDANFGKFMVRFYYIHILSTPAKF